MLMFTEMNVEVRGANQYVTLMDEGGRIHKICSYFHAVSKDEGEKADFCISLQIDLTQTFSLLCTKP